METKYKVSISVTKEMLEMMQYGYLLEHSQLSRWEDEYVLKGIAMGMSGDRWSSLEEFHAYVKNLEDQSDIIQSIIDEHWTKND
jgi:hypothetical protein